MYLPKETGGGEGRSFPFSNWEKKKGGNLGNFLRGLRQNPHPEPAEKEAIYWGRKN